MNSDIKKYINEIKKIIPINSKDKKDFLKMMEQRILESSNLENKCDYDNIVKEFGKPNEVAASYIEEIDTDTILKILKRKQYIKWLISILIIAIILISIFKIYRLNQLYEIAKNELDLREELEIIEE
ncbi:MULTISPECIES: DUF6120 family protein [Bacillota]|jgi:uncharacterized membrane protein|uniref:Uncharacterized protein n=1 Tax=Thomasclavelia cocleata TaxID=69824 RepID=A0A1I0DKI2_9FIRM|nr:MULTISPECIES: DUF6120 family protein [Bacillota]MCI9132553.1 hypothetical protein [Thomasclavelia cocleata]MCI9631529.1 hypothetical protein [Thomasclavelia cocleata]MCR1961265.1 DUF6120 family protein [Thomasclavelia cocleata]NDO42693.1 hypothetical protein [Thomasclavelia cocleata]PJN80474.1 hypothetical protein CWE04_08595 [Thomasclavelia cocleata]